MRRRRALRKRGSVGAGGAVEAEPRNSQTPPNGAVVLDPVKVNTKGKVVTRTGLELLC